MKNTDYIAGVVAELAELFKCIDDRCDNRGNIPHQVSDDEWEAQKCQFCFEKRFPMIESLRTKLKEAQVFALREVMPKRNCIIWDNGTCSICGYESIDETDHRCEIENDCLSQLKTNAKEKLDIDL